MEKIIRAALLTLLVAAPLAVGAQSVGLHGGNGWGTASSGGQGGNGWQAAPLVGTCGVTRIAAFEAFVAEFRAAYSCVQLVLPSEVSTRELRPDNSRYFAEMDKFGRITGGRFQ
jgi:hypothetical protein